MSYPFQRDTRDRDQVRGQHRSDAKGDDLHECDGGSKVDARENHDENHRNIG